MTLIRLRSFAAGTHSFMRRPSVRDLCYALTNISKRRVVLIYYINTL